MAKRRRSRRYLIAEAQSTDLAEYSEYQPSHRAGRLPIFDDGLLHVCVLPTDSAKLIFETLKDRTWEERIHWRYPTIKIYSEVP